MLAKQERKKLAQAEKLCPPAPRPLVTAADVAQADRNMAALLLEEAKSKTKGNTNDVTASSGKGDTKKKR